MTREGPLTFEAEIFKIVDALRVNQLDELVDGPSVVLAQVALGRDVVVLSRPACEPFLLKCFFVLSFLKEENGGDKRKKGQRTSLRQAAKQDSLVAVKIRALSRPLSILLGTRSNVHGRLHTFSIFRFRSND